MLFLSQRVIFLVATGYSVLSLPTGYSVLSLRVIVYCLCHVFYLPCLLSAMSSICHVCLPLPSFCLSRRLIVNSICHVFYLPCLLSAMSSICHVYLCHLLVPSMQTCDGALCTSVMAPDALVAVVARWVWVMWYAGRGSCFWPSSPGFAT